MNENRLISAPVGIVADIASVLGVPSSDLGYLCSNLHGHTNKWSRFKPLVHFNNDRSYHLLEEYENGGTLYMGDGTCGLDIPYTEAISNAVASEKYFNGEMKWGYIAPEPNAKQPARALDFDGYYHEKIEGTANVDIELVYGQESFEIAAGESFSIYPDSEYFAANRIYLKPKALTGRTVFSNR